MRVGSAEWCTATGGRLRFGDRATLLGQAMLAQCQLLPESLKARLGRLPAVRALEAESLELPDSAAARAAEEALGELAEPYLVNHSVRTFLWSHLLGQLDEIAHDVEALYVASLLHDIALLEKSGAGGGACFAIRGAELARALVRARGFSAEREGLVADCITYHLNPAVPLEAGAEPHLMHRGVLFDVIGLRTWRIAPSDRDAVLHRFPRERMKLQLSDLFEADARAHPEARAHFALRWLQFRRRVFAAPFSE